MKLQLPVMTQQRSTPSTGKDQYLSIVAICIKISPFSGLMHAKMVNPPVMNF